MNAAVSAPAPTFVGSMFFGSTSIPQSAVATRSYHTQPLLLWLGAIIALGVLGRRRFRGGSWPTDLVVLAGAGGRPRVSRLERAADPGRAGRRGPRELRRRDPAHRKLVALVGFGLGRLGRRRRRAGSDRIRLRTRASARRSGGCRAGPRPRPGRARSRWGSPCRTIPSVDRVRADGEQEAQGRVVTLVLGIRRCRTRPAGQRFHWSSAASTYSHGLGSDAIDRAMPLKARSISRYHPASTFPRPRRPPHRQEHLERARRCQTVPRSSVTLRSAGDRWHPRVSRTRGRSQSRQVAPNTSGDGWVLACLAAVALLALIVFITQNAAPCRGVVPGLARPVPPRGGTPCRGVHRLHRHPDSGKHPDSAAETYSRRSRRVRAPDVQSGPALRAVTADCCRFDDPTQPSAPARTPASAGRRTRERAVDGGTHLIPATSNASRLRRTPSSSS